MAKAAEIWQRGIARDLTEAVGKELEAKVAHRSSRATGGAGSGSAAPAPADDAAAPQPEAPELKGLDAPVQ